MRLDLEVDDVVLLVVLMVEERDAEVVEVKADDRRNASKPFPMAVKVVEQKHRMLPHMLQRLLGRLPEEAHAHMLRRPLTLDARMLATSLEKPLRPPRIPRKHDALGLQMVGKAQQQVQAPPPSQPPRHGQTGVEFPVSVIRMTLIHDVRDETEGKGTVHAVPFSMTETGKPNEWIGHFLHLQSTKIRFFYVIFKQRPHFSCYFSCSYHLINVNSLRKTTL